MKTDNQYKPMLADFDYIEDLHNPDIIQSIWEKGIVVDGYNENLYRQDAGGAWISREAYNAVDRDMGWEIDHIYPVCKGGQNHFVNLRPMNCKNNRSKSDHYPKYTAAVTSKENRNILQDTVCEVAPILQEKLKKLYNL